MDFPRIREAVWLKSDSYEQNRKINRAEAEGTRVRRESDAGGYVRSTRGGERSCF